MKFLQAFRMALSAIWGNKMRSSLTMLGIIIGVIAVSVLIAIGQGTTAQISKQLEGIGTNLIQLTFNQRNRATIGVKDVLALADEESIEYIAPMMSQNGTIKAGSETMDVSIEASVPGYDQIRNLEMDVGRFLLDTDQDYRLNVAVMGSAVAETLYGSAAASIGQIVVVNNRNFTVVGVLKSRGTSASGTSDEFLLIPLSSAQRLYQTKRISQIYASAYSSAEVEAAKEKLTAYALDTSGNSNAYRVFSQDEMLETLSQTTESLTLMLGGIAGISLLVGGIGIMNIMLVSVTERTREIGVRKAIGAKRRDILTQFIIEALVISGLGGLIGLALSFALSGLLASLLDMTMDISLTIAELAIAFSLLMGVVFGVYPANKASKLSPIEALRQQG